jgi:hypothetical protein
VFCLWSLNKATSSGRFGETSPWSLYQIHFDTFFDSQVVVHKGFVPEWKSVIEEFYTGVTNRLLKRIHRFRSAAFCSRALFLLHDTASAHKAARVCQFYTPKTLQLLSLAVLFRFIFFSLLKIKLKWLQFADVAKIQAAVNDEIKKIQREEISETLQKIYHRAKPFLHVYANKSYVK